MATDLYSISYFEHCSRRDLRSVERSSTRLMFNAGRTITRRATVGDQILVICSGTVVIEREDQYVATASDGDVLSELTRTSDVPVTLHALDDCEILVIGRQEFNALALDVPDVAERLQAAAVATSTMLHQSAPVLR